MQRSTNMRDSIAYTLLRFFPLPPVATRAFSFLAPNEANTFSMPTPPRLGSLGAVCDISAPLRARPDHDRQGSKLHSITDKLHTDRARYRVYTHSYMILPTDANTPTCIGGGMSTTQRVQLSLTHPHPCTGIYM